MASVPIRINQKPQTLLHAVQLLLTNKSNHPAVILLTPGGETVVTYSEFFDQAMKYAQALDEVGIAPRDLVVSVLNHGETVLYSFWGALLHNAIPSIFPFLTDKLDRDHYLGSVRQLVENSGVRAVITNNEMLSLLSNQLAGIPSLAGIINSEQMLVKEAISQDFATVLPTPDDIAFLQHSSGSTGLQKGVMLSHRNVLNQVASYSEAIDLRPDDVVVSWLPLYHDMGLIAGFIMPILQGIPLVLMSPFHWVREPQILLRAITNYQGTLCWLPNFAYNFLATRIRDTALEGIDLSSIRAFINCSEPVHADSHRIFARRFAPYGLKKSVLTTCYAMAENTFAVTQTDIGSLARIDRVHRNHLMEHRVAESAPSHLDDSVVEIVSCGRPVENCEVQIVGAQREALPERHVGEIIIRSDSMLSGYYHRDDLTRIAIYDGWYFTGDMGYLADGELYVTGRKKDLIIVGGKNIYPQDIENLLNDIQDIHPGRTVAFGVYNDRLGTEDIAVLAEVEHVELLDDEERKAEIIRTIRSRIAQNTETTARHVHLVPPRWLLKTSSGKIARTANREKFLKELDQQYAPE